MTRALIAVGAALALLVGGLVLVVVLTSGKDKIQVDNALSEDFTREVQLSQGPGATVDLRELAPFDWTRALVVAPGTSHATLEQRLGYRWEGLQGLEAGRAMVILLDSSGKVVRFFEYRGAGRFEGFATPIADVPRDRAVFRVSDLVIKPKG
jgi:hypothetical protein